MQVIGYARAGLEFEVRDLIRAGGAIAEVPRLVKAVSKGKKRRPELVTAAYLPNYVFIDVDVCDYVALTATKGLAASLLHVPQGYTAYLKRWMAAIDAEAAQAEERHQRGETINEYQEGEALRIIGGPLMDWLDGQAVTFEKIVEHGRMDYPSVVARANIMGKSTRLEIDPLHVKAAG